MIKTANSLQDMDASENSGTPQIIHFSRVFHYFHHPFWGTPIFGNTHMEKHTHTLLDYFGLEKSNNKLMNDGIFQFLPPKGKLGTPEGPKVLVYLEVQDT